VIYFVSLRLKGGSGYVNYNQLNTSAAEMERVLALAQDDLPKAISIPMGCRVTVTDTRPMPHKDGYTYLKDGVPMFMAMVDVVVSGKKFDNVTAYHPVMMAMLGITAAEYQKLSEEKKKVHYDESNIERQRWMVHMGLNEFHGNISFVMKECDIHFVDDGL